jgi:hypothetical protein
MKRTFKKKGFDIQYKQPLYVVKKHFRPHTPMTNHTYMVEGNNKKFYRSEIQPVEKSTENEVPDRPVFDKSFRGVTAKTRVMRNERKTYKIDPVSTTRKKSERKRTRNKLFL